MTEDWKVIVSTKSGCGRAETDWTIISQLLDNKGIKYTVDFTEYRFHAIELASSAISEGYRKLLGIGGDGTIHEILNGVFEQKTVPTTEITLAIMPVGSGNDWARLHNIPKRYEEAIEVITSSMTVAQDVALVSSFMKGRPYRRYMINIGGLGFDANVCHHFDKLKEKGKTGDRQYLKCVLKGFLGYTQRKFKVIADGNVFYEGNVFSISMGIGKYSGGGMMQTPDAVYDDGLINLTVVKQLPKLRVLLHVKKLFKGNIYKVRSVIHTMAKTLVIQAWPSSRVEVDGEDVGNCPILVEVLPKSINVITNTK
ncbi:MAG: diacylglycerol kinase family protein [Bacteroidales bacterium]|nr:diacylglycerol kinase family protein [Bacteroidales bacterium]MDD4669654.1 diacylglycerol kinase family protein [Bacteroidales bacterium]